jgi:hypothetical protein
VNFGQLLVALESAFGTDNLRINGARFTRTIAPAGSSANPTCSQSV